jgi:hypothetical protein
MAKDPPAYGAGKSAPGTTPYLGNVGQPTPAPNVPPPTLRKPGSLSAQAPFGNTVYAHTQEAYKRGDQVKLLPSNGAALAQLQQGLYQAGYITDAQYKRMVLGSPDDVTTLAFSKLLATSNMSGTVWQETLSTRLAAAAQQAPDKGKETPPLTVSLTDPAAIRQTLDVTSRKLLGGYMTPEQKDAFVAQFQASQSASQSAAYYQTYNPGVGYGPGGTTTTPDLEGQAREYAKTTDPNQYKATQFGSQVHSALESLRSTGYLNSEGPA